MELNEASLTEDNLNEHVIMVQEDLFSMQAIKVSKKFSVGDSVYKHSGDYNWSGVVVGVITKLDGTIRIVVSHKADKGEVLHIYNPNQLIKVKDTYDRENYQKLLARGY